MAALQKRVPQNQNLRYSTYRMAVCLICGIDVPFEPTDCAAMLASFRREEVSPTISSINLSNCRRCHKRKPLPFILESPNGHVSLRICAECSVILDQLQRPSTQPKGSLVSVGSSGRPAVRNEGRSGSPTVPSARQMHGKKREGSGEAASAHPLNRQGSEYLGQTSA